MKPPRWPDTEPLGCLGLLFVFALLSMGLALCQASLNPQGFAP